MKNLKKNKIITKTAFGLTALVSMLLLSNCSDRNAARYKDPQLSFSHLEKFNFNAAHVYIKDKPNGIVVPASLPEDFLSPVPHDVVQTIVEDRFISSPESDPESAVTIEFIEEKITELPPEIMPEPTKPLTFWEKTVLRKQEPNFNKYKIEISFKVLVNNPSTNYMNNYMASAWQTVSIPDNASYNERKYNWFIANEKLATVINDNLDKELRSVFSGVLLCTTDMNTKSDRGADAADIDIDQEMDNEEAL